MRHAWNTVRTGLRHQDVMDLHDYYDFHRSVDALIERLQADICAGLYRPRISQQIRLEKTANICRRIHLPSPEDALILQTLSDALARDLLASQPCNNAYYKRTHDIPNNPSHIDETFPYTSSEL